jgi:enoyl-CoA hydratase/carnithine racemase
MYHMLKAIEFKGIAMTILHQKTVDSVITLTLDDPTSRNALSREMIDTLSQAFDEINASSTIKAVIINAVGPVFCSGHNLKQIKPDIFAYCSKLMVKIATCNKPTIAAVQGIATAAGAQLVAACDLAIASDNATFCTPGVNLGMFCFTPSVAISRNISKKHAMEMLLLGGMNSADDAMRFGLINKVTSSEFLMHEAQAWAQILITKSPHAIKTGKAAFHAQTTMTLEESYTYMSRVMAEEMMSADSKEGTASFIQKRKPVWS